MGFFTKLFGNKKDKIKEIVAQRNLRPLGNKMRLLFEEGVGALDYRAQFRDRPCAEKYYEAFVRYAESNPPPVLIEVMVAYTPNTIYAEKYSFILPYFDHDDIHQEYQRWAKNAVMHCNDQQMQHSYCSGNDYRYVPVGISSKGAVIRWAILPPKGFDPESPAAQVLLIDPPEMGYNAVAVEGA